MSSAVALISLTKAVTVSQLLPLELLAPGESARVVEVDGRPDLVHRLTEMGLRAGSRIRMIQAGSPCLVAVDDHRLSFRCDEIATVLVEPAAHGA